MMRPIVRTVLPFALGLTLAAAPVAVTAGGPPVTPTDVAAGPTASVVALPGYQVSVFTMGASAYKNPDSLVSDGTHVYVGYQNVTAKDGTDNKTSTIAEYTAQGQLVRTFRVLGHCDGLRYNPVTRQLWALTDEDGNPHLTTIDPSSGASVLYRTLPTPHGGGYDDLAFLDGVALIDASNPTLNAAGLNAAPALDTITLSGGKVTLTPVLMGNASALDTTTQKMVTLNEIDPDSLTVDPAGRLVLDNQGGRELVFLSHVGTPRQTVTRVPLDTQVDDTIWPSAAQGRLLVADTTANTVYALRTRFATGTPYAATPNDSGVAGFVGTINLSSGTITPVAIGFHAPHGELFLPDSVR